MKLQRTMLFTMIAIMFSFTAVAQTDSTKASGNWNAAATWKSGTVPTGSGIYIVRSTDSVYFSAAATITGTLKTLSGKIGVFDSSKVVFGNGGIYEHAVNGGTLIKATWNTGSTCLITGVVGNAPSNGNQNFYNLTWNCPGQTGGLNLGMTNNTIAGTVRIMNSNSQYFRLTAGGSQPASGKKIITINGDVVLDTVTAYFTSTGSSSPNDTFSVVVKGNINSMGTFNMSNGSAGLVSWYVAGNINAGGGSFTTHSSAPLADTLIFNGTTKQTFTRGGAVTSSNIRFIVKSGAIVDFDTNTVGGSAASTFTLEPGGTLITGHTKGLVGNLNNGSTTTLDTAANYEYDGIHPQADTLLPAVVKNLTIRNDSGVTLKKPLKINGILTLRAGVLDNTIPFTLGPSGTIAYQGGSLKIPVTSVRPGNEQGIPKSFFVDQNYPNPFNPSTTITYGIAKNSFVTAKIFNLLGQEVATIFSGFKNAGVYTLNVNASHLSSGVYLYRIQADNVVETKRMILMK